MISIIAAVGHNYEIGKNGDLCWRIKADLERFKKLTTGHIVVMGYNTYKSLGFKPLENRTNIVITKEYLSEDINKGIDQVLEKDVKEVLEEWVNDEEEIFVIGGGKWYKYFLPYTSQMYLTVIHKTDPNADTFFPRKADWRGEWKEKVEEGDDEYTYVTYTKIDPELQSDDE